MTDYRQVARRSARKYGLDTKTFLRQIAAESGFNPNARSPAGARGIAQIMPATAKGWGVNPDDPKAALDASAKNMAGYVKKYSSYENALRAYNAGPGNIERSKGFKETNNYVKTILNGREPSRTARAAPQSNAPANPEVPAASPQLSALGMLWAKYHPDSLIAKMGLLNTMPGEDTETASTTTQPNTEVDGGKAVQSKGDPSEIRELFYDRLGAWKNGTKLAKPIGGHDHVHLAGADRKRTIALGKLAQKMGLAVGENSYFTGHKETSGHAPNSNHYDDTAFDASGAPDREAAFVRLVRKKYGLR